MKMFLVAFSVKGVILNNNPEGVRKWLLLKRSSDSDYGKEDWEFPGGKPRSLNLKKELAREIKEETGLAVSVGSQIAVLVQ